MVRLSVSLIVSPSMTRAIVNVAASPGVGELLTTRAWVANHDDRQQRGQEATGHTASLACWA
jgi:hypothetical protein